MDSLIKNDQKFRFWHFFPPISLIEPVMGPSIKDARTLRGGGERGRGVRQKWTNAERGRGWLAKRGRPLGKKL